MIINHKHKYIFIHIPKSAGSSITKALYPFSNKHDLFLGCDCGPEKLTKEDGFTLHKHSPALDIKTYATPERWKEYFIFSFVRHPIDRIISLYEWWKETNGSWDPETKNKICKMTFKEFVFSDYTGRNQTEFLISGHENKHHFTDAKYSIEVDFIGKYNSLHRDFSYICGLLNLPQINLEHQNKSTNRKQKQDSYLDEEIIKEIKRKFNTDYRVFNFQ